MHPRDQGDTEPELRPSWDASKRQAVLLVSSVRDRTMVVLPAHGALTIGRAPTSASQSDDGAIIVTLLDDTLLSRRHLRISATAHGHEIEDLGSRNGTFVDGRRIDQPTRLCDGAIVLFGNHAAAFRLVSEVELVALGRDAAHPLGPIPTLSPALAVAHDRFRKLATTEVELLLLGEAGVGKEAYARAIHHVLGRRGPFIVVHCAVQPADLERALFGDGGAVKVGKRTSGIAASEGGTLLFDEIGELPPELQTKILRFFRDRSIYRPGALHPRHLDVRILASTSRTAAAGSGAAGLSPALAAALGPGTIALPPLRRRPEDVPSLIGHFGGGSIRGVEPSALRALCLHAWPLNVRELEKAIAAALLMSTGGTLRLEHLPSAIRAGLMRGAPLEDRRRQPRSAPDRGELENLLIQHDGNVASVARALDRKWNVVHRWLTRYKLKSRTFRKGND